jgi:hypothetical protein
MVIFDRILLKYPVLVLLYFLSLTCSYSQGNSISQNTDEINRKLKVLSRPTPDSPGGYIIDNSYEGLLGSPYLFDKFLPILVKADDIEYYVPVEANIDLKNSTLIYIEKESGDLFSLPCQRISEVLVELEKDRLIFRTTVNKNFKRSLKEERFYQVLKEAPNEFIKMPYKVLIPADYRGGYSAKRRYDEYKSEISYYILDHDNSYTEVSLNRKSLIKLFPDKKDIIKKVSKEKTYSDREEMVLAILKKL